VSDANDGIRLTLKDAAPEVYGKLLTLARRFPNEVKRAQLRSASIVVRKIRAAVQRMGTKDTGSLPPLSSLRQVLWPSEPAGGVLTRNASALCRVQRRGPVLHAGYVEGVEGVFSRWQEGGSTPLEPFVRSQLHRMLAYGGQRNTTVPDVAEQPARPVIAPIFRITSKEYPAWVLGAALKQIDKTLGRAGA
jgi:hypothetical protein